MSHAGRWSTVAAELAKRSDGLWACVGTGVQTELVQQPVAWWLPTVGVEPQRDARLLYAAYRPAFMPMPNTIGLRQDDVRPGSSYSDGADWSVGFDHDPSDGLAKLERWVNGPAGQYLAAQVSPDGQLYEQMWAGQIGKRRATWLPLAGTRVIYQTGSASEVVDAALPLMQKWGFDEATREYWENFAIAIADSRPEALRFLRSFRAVTLTRAGLSDHAAVEEAG
ncbi:hypothetical protein [Nakamurella aerolata]|uniref:Uncharacterized protein n=1 Tax=Nakamurella aerolata TaxID=1656892 RepID=A0A849AHI5_9ACTN|nr:hypothetical protein [Nakamurella aerolata]NNG36302.1 hypothetical protein [Nakamurella aerolata]